MITLSDLGIISALGEGKTSTLKNALSGNTAGMQKVRGIIPNQEIICGVVNSTLPQINLPQYDIRANRLLLAVVEQLKESIARLKKEYPLDRLGIVLGSSNTGIEEAQNNINHWLAEGVCPKDFDISHLELGSPSAFLQDLCGFRGPAYTVSTACSSAAKAISSGKKLLQYEICDGVLVGGVDALCSLATNGFFALEALSTTLTNPLSINRSGINLGEGAALFIMERDKGGIQLLGAGESSDAYHLTAPDPEGAGAKSAMLAALAEAEIPPSAIDYINLHGTGTTHNDKMETKAIFELFSDSAICASTKPLTGHLLGAAGALELALSWLMLSNFNKEKELIPHVFDNAPDPELSPIRLAQKNEHGIINTILSNSFAFGGSNVTLIIGKDF
jgi:3-oxoacyl-[acyl-carrier-protein] synthase-1